MKCSVSSLIQRGDTDGVMDSGRRERTEELNELCRIGYDLAKYRKTAPPLTREVAPWCECRCAAKGYLRSGLRWSSK